MPYKDPEKRREAARIGMQKRLHQLKEWLESLKEVPG